MNPKVKYFKTKNALNVQGNMMKKKCMKPEVHFCGTQTTICYQANSNFILREIAGEYILVPTGKELENFNGLATINGTGAFLWKLLHEPKSIDEIIKCFAKEFDLTTEESANDICDFLDPAVTKHVILKCC